MKIYVSQIEDPEIRSYLKDRTDTESVAKGFVLLAQQAERRSEWQDAVALYGEALRNKPQDPVIRYCGECGRGYCLMKQGALEDAVRYLSAAIKTNPDFCHAYRLLGNAAEGLGRYKLAVECYLSAVLKKTDDKESWDYLLNLIAAHPLVINEFDNLSTAMRGARRLLEESGALPRSSYQ